jgi:hypothetical protein
MELVELGDDYLVLAVLEMPSAYAVEDCPTMP